MTDETCSNVPWHVRGTGRQQCSKGGKLGSGNDDQGGLSDSQDALGERITVR
jgi:hypothetical protein